MKKYIFIRNLIFTFTMLVLVCCDGVFIPDPIDPRLPKYTEEGNNVAGAFINDEIWKSVVRFGFMTAADEPYIFLYNSKDSLCLRFEGKSNVYSIIEFRLSNLGIHRFEDLILLKDKKIQLDGVKNSGVCLQSENYYYDIDFTNCHCKGGIGQLYIKNVTMNDSLSRATLSGTFGFTFNDSINGNIELSYGRFDYRFGKDSNFIIDRISL